MVPMIGSMGCPYKCNFCIDSVVDYQPLGFDRIREDLVYLQRKIKRPTVAWHDPKKDSRYWVTPTGNFRGGNGEACRSFTTQAVIDGQTQQAL